MFYITCLFIGYYGLFLLLYSYFVLFLHLVVYIQYDIIVFIVCLYVICDMAMG